MKTTSLFQANHLFFGVFFGVFFENLFSRPFSTASALHQDVDHAQNQHLISLIATNVDDAQNEWRSHSSPMNGDRSHRGNAAPALRGNEAQVLGKAY